MKPYNSMSLQNNRDVPYKKSRWETPGGFDRSFTTLPITHNSRSSPVVTPTRSMLRRYSLADVSFMSPNNGRNKHSSMQESSDLSYTCTQIDSKSPGYAGRVIQYNEEQEKSFPVYQSKYNRPGVFPIVHFFKKDLPSLQKKHINVRINSPELSRYNTPEQNRMLLETIIHSTPEKLSPHNNEVNTKSVLDALKEISRKRIHSSEEEFILKDDGKRTCIDYVGGPNARKKVKLNTSQLDDSHKSYSNRIRSLDELKASQTSMDEEPVEKQKIENRNVSENTSLIYRSPTQVTFADVETQTPMETQTVELVTETKKVCDEKEQVNNNNQEKKIKKMSPVKVFDETPLETMRKNRLVALMGSLTKEKETKAIDSNLNETKKPDKPVTTEKPLISILSGPVKSPNKSNKHVTFNIPNTVSETSTDVPQFSVDLTKAATSGYDSLTKTSTALVTPIVSSSATEISSLKKTEAITENNSPKFSIPPTQAVSNTVQAQTKPVTFTAAVQPSLFSITKEQVSGADTVNNKNASSPSISTYNFTAKSEQKSFNDSAKPIQSGGIAFNNINRTNNSNTLQNSPAASTSSTVIPSFTFGDKANTVSSSKSEAPTEKGGFKFDLKPQTTSANLKPSFSFGPPNKSLSFSPVSQNESSKVSMPNASTMSQNNASNIITTSSNFVFLPTSSVTATLTTSDASSRSFRIPSGGFSGGSNTIFSTSSGGNIFSVPENKFPTSTTTTTLNFGGNAPNTNASLPSTFTKTSLPSKVNVPTTQTDNKASTFMASNLTNKPAGFSFSSNGNAGTTPFSLGFNSTTPGMFASAAKSTAITTAVTATTSNPTIFFGSVTQSTTPSTTSEAASNVFNKPIASFGSSNGVFGSMLAKTTTTNSATNFGVVTPSFNANSSAFGGNKAQISTFTADNSKSTFGQGNGPQFGTPTVTTTASVFGGNNNVPTFGTPNAFAAPRTTTNNNIFGNTNTCNFGTVTTASTFGTNTSASTFGTTTTASPFGTTKTASPFGSTATAPPFGATTTAPPFGATTTAPPFGATTTAPPFGATTTAPPFGTTTAAPPFGTTTVSPFGTTTTTASPFGTTTTASPFGTTTVAPPFGATTTANPFATTTSASTFGTTTAAPTFGTNTGTNFGTTNFGLNQNSGFSGTGASASSSFGNMFSVATTTNTTTTDFNSTRVFNQTSNNMFSSSFGEGSTFGKSVKGNSQFETPPFQSSTNAFGGDTFSANPPVTKSDVFTFGVNANKPAVFSFGVSEPPKPNFNFTAENSSNFGGANKTFGGPSAFGSPSTSQFNVQPGPPGMFNIGTSSVTPTRSRTQLKAKRRT